MPYRAEHPKLAVIDIGSNSVRMVIYDLTHTPPEKIFNEKLFCALGRDLGTTGRLNPEGAAAAVKALKAYRLICDVQHIADIAVVGTAALRDAQDGPDFIAQVLAETGLPIRVISGDEEARYAARGVLMEIPEANGVVADFGGGSLELARVGDNRITDTVSLQLGAYRVLALGEGAEGAIRDMLLPLAGRFGKHPTFYAIGGSWRSLAKCYRQDHADDHLVPAAAMMSFCQKVTADDPARLQSHYRLEEHRAQLAPVAAFVLYHTLSILAPHVFASSLAGVRDGIVHEFLCRIKEKR